jgi:hypothetical protein
MKNGNVDIQLYDLDGISFCSFNDIAKFISRNYPDIPDNVIVHNITFYHDFGSYGEGDKATVIVDWKEG